MAFAESMTDPPPTARMKSIPSSRHSWIPSRTRLSLGFGFTPASSTCPTPAAVRLPRTRSRSPERSAEPPEWCTSTLFEHFAVSAPTWASTPLPKNIVVLLLNTKLFICLSLSIQTRPSAVRRGAAPGEEYTATGAGIQPCGNAAEPGVGGKKRRPGGCPGATVRRCDRLRIGSPYLM